MMMIQVNFQEMMNTATADLSEGATAAYTTAMRMTIIKIGMKPSAIKETNSGTTAGRVPQTVETLPKIEVEATGADNRTDHLLTAIRVAIQDKR